MDIFTIILNILIGIFFILSILGALYSCKTESTDFIHDYFGVPKEYVLPDEITIEIVKDNSDQPEVTQPEHSSEPSKASEHPSSVSVSHPTEKAGCIPE